MNLKEKLNHLGSEKKPFLFIINYDLSEYEVIPLDRLPKDIKYSFNHLEKNKHFKKELVKTPIKFKTYLDKFNTIHNEIKEGNTYLINLTSTTDIKLEDTLEDIYQYSSSKYKLLYKDKFVCFSPERFCNIKENKIYTYPMKGTIDAKINNAKEILLNDQKELSEHTMVVDLLRNDLSMVSTRVNVDKFRYIEKINAGNKELLQMSSKISGELNYNWHEKIGDILTTLLPAGSITGTPKKKTIEIIKKVEEYNRGYFTGVFGIYDGVTLDSAVMIRFIEKTNENNYVYKSGGGITSDSDVNKEYQEMIDKVYIG